MALLEVPDCVINLKVQVRSSNCAFFFLQGMEMVLEGTLLDLPRSSSLLLAFYFLC